MAAGAQKAGKQGSCFPTCFRFSSIFGKQKQKKKKKKKPREQIDPRVSSTPEYSEDRLRGKTRTINSRWFNFKPDKSGRKRPPADPRNTQKLEGHGIGGTDLEKANITAADRKNFGSSNSGVGHHVSGNPQARPAVKTFPTPTAHQRQQEVPAWIYELEKWPILCFREHVFGSEEEKKRKIPAVKTVTSSNRCSHRAKSFLQETDNFTWKIFLGAWRRKSSNLSFVRKLQRDFHRVSNLPLSHEYFPPWPSISVIMFVGKIFLRRAEILGCHQVGFSYVRKSTYQARYQRVHKLTFDRSITRSTLPDYLPCFQ